MKRPTIIVNIHRAGHRAIIEEAKAEGRFVLIDRSSIWGNPYTDQPSGTLAKFVVRTREEAIARYDEYLSATPSLLVLLPTLSGCVLGCWCAPKRCHGEIIVKRMLEAIK